MRHETFPEIPAADRDVRAEVTLLCEVRQGMRPWRMVRLEDISQDGFRISWLPDCAPDKPLRIRIAGLQILNADVRWREGKACGCSFVEPLHVAVFQHIVARAQSAG